MLFNSLQYALFLPLVVAVYYIVPKPGQLWVLLIASYWFYASWNPISLILLFGLTLVNHLFGLGLGRAGRSRAGRWLLGGAVGVNIAVLGLFKYSLFALQSWNAVFSVPENWLQNSIILPLGISFFVFEFIHYQVDIWRGNKPIGSLLNFAIFAAFFPTQIAGPIKRYENFEKQLTQPIHFEESNLWEGLHLIVIGLFKKMVLADNLAPLVVLGFQQQQPGKIALSTTDAWLVVFAFGSQLYFDFSGYTDIGRGSARLLGFSVPKNFNRPAVATNILRLWGRWHLSLTSWLTDYVYTPLGGKRQRYRNLFLTMLIGGLWHGANWTFVIWGGLHGLMLSGYWYLKIKQWLPVPRKTLSRSIWAVFSWLLTFLLLHLTLVFFRAATLEQAFAMFGSLFALNNSRSEVLLTSECYIIGLICLGRIGVDFLLEYQKWLRNRLPGWLVGWQSWLGPALREMQPVGYALLVASIILLRPVQTIRFIYFQF